MLEQVIKTHYDKVCTIVSRGKTIGFAEGYDLELKRLVSYKFIQATIYVPRAVFNLDVFDMIKNNQEYPFDLLNSEGIMVLKNCWFSGYKSIFILDKLQIVEGSFCVGEMCKNTYRVYLDQGQGSSNPVECFSLDEALEEATSVWGEGCVSIEKPDGSWHEFPENWNVAPLLSFITFKDSENLNPKQEHLLKIWKQNPKLKRFISGLEKRPETFSNVYSEIKELDDSAIPLLFNSLTWGLFHIITWNSCSALPKNWKDLIK